MINLTVKQLRYFDALARHGHFGRAAADVAISQPALSVQIRELEAQFGGPLVERGARHVRLTPLGKQVLARARAALLALYDLEMLARLKTDALAGRLRLGVIPTVAPYLLPGLIGTLEAHTPRLDLKLREAVTASLLAELRAGQLDMALVALPMSEPDLQEYPLLDEDFVLVRPRHQDGAPVPGPDELPQMKLLLLEEGHCFRDQALSFCHMSAPSHEVMEGSALSTLVQMVGAGLGVTLIPDMAIAQESRAADVAIARFAAPCPSRRIGLVWRRASPFADTLEGIAATLRRAIPRPVE